MSSTPSTAMTFTDYLGFASMTLLLIGAAHWGVVAIRYALGDLPDWEKVDGELHMMNATNYTVHDVYKAAPTPDLINLLTDSPDVQLIIYWVVFAAGLFYMGLFIWNSVEMRTVEA